ncbi:MAG: hypothetical protein AUJ12_02880 [Alphaproteobacteria bacterium CG1_02_46_17]|nr:MAG: hypothetical protein AUJ12_02880 [Alphaproteobacteria bacterium CG1_02_46_17]
MDKTAALGVMTNSFYELEYRAQNPTQEEGFLADGKRAAAAGIAKTKAVADMGAVGLKLDKAPNVTKLVTDVAAKSTDVKPFADAIAQKYKQDPNFIEKLEADMGTNPQLAEQLQSQILKDQAQASQIISKYNGSNLAELVKPAPVAPKPSVQAKAPDTPSPVTVAASGVTQKKEAAPPAAATTAPAAKPETPSPAEIKVPPMPGEKVGVADIGKAAFAELANKSNSEIADFFTHGVTGKDGKIAQLGEGIAGQAAKYGVSASLIDGFEKRLSTDTKLQERIAENLKEHPDFVKRLAKMSSDESAPPDAQKTAIKKELEHMMSNPELLADKNHISGLEKKMEGGDFLSKIGDFFKNNMGFDLGGMMAGIGPALQEMMQKLMDMLGKLFGKSGISMASGNQDMGGNLRSQYELSSMKAMPTEGSLFREVKHGDKMVKEVNTIQVEGADGKPLDVIPTDGAIRVGQGANGDVRLRVAGSIGQDGDVKYTRDVYLSKNGFDTYKAEVAMRNAEVGVKDQKPQQTVHINHETGQEFEKSTPQQGSTQPSQDRMAQTFPVSNPGPVEVRPLSPLGG